MAKLFYLQRTEDESGISGTGRIAQGIIFDNGKVALTWLSDTPSTAIYDSIGDVRSIHGHEGRTEIMMEQDWKRSFNELKSAIGTIDIVSTIKEKIPEGSNTKELIENIKDKK